MIGRLKSVVEISRLTIWGAGVLCIGIFFLYVPSVHAEDVDTDSDGLSDIQESRYYSDPRNPDTDGDGYMDGMEVRHGYSPLHNNGTRMSESDYDHDGLFDALEMLFHTDMGNADTDGDGYGDFEEVLRGYNPADTTSTRQFSREIIVDRTVQHLYYVVNGTRVLDFPVSTGNPGSETPAGTYAVSVKIPKKRYVGRGYDLPNVMWNMQFLPSYYIHTAYWHNDFGKRTHSHGCVNLREADAEILYKYIDIGVPVVITGTTPKQYRVGT